LKKALERVSGEQERPSAALQARTLHLMVRLLMTKPKGRDAILRDLSRVVRGAAGLVGYPLQPLVEQVTELGEVLGQSKAYEELFDLVVDTIQKRKGEIATGAQRLFERLAHAQVGGQRQRRQELGQSQAFRHVASTHSMPRGSMACARTVNQCHRKRTAAATGSGRVVAMQPMSLRFSDEHGQPHTTFCSHEVFRRADVLIDLVPSARP
jgi:hypothetical protein